MREVKVHHASNIGDRIVNPVTILITEDLGDYDKKTLAEMQQTLCTDALDLLNALCNSLPQGTLERLAVYLWEHIVSSYLGAIRPLETGERAVVDAALREYIGHWHSNACNARSARDSGQIKFCDRIYEEAVETYKRLIGRDPTT